MKKYLVYGMGKSGIEAALLLNRVGKKVEIIDNNDYPGLQMRKESLSKAGIQVRLGFSGKIKASNYEKIVVSPGIDIRNIKELAENENVISEIELASLYMKGRILSVTGSNGKSTTVSLLGRIFNDAEIPGFIAGNIGNPLSSIADKTIDECTTVIELSSFQLEKIWNFKSDIAVLLNLTPDHLNRYSNVQEYYKTKMRIFENQTETDFAIVNADDLNINKFIKMINSQIVYYSVQDVLAPGIYLKDNKIFYNLKGLKGYEDSDECYLMDADELGIPGPHNIMNSMAAALTAIISGLGNTTIVKSLKNFHGIHHRLEFVRTLNGIDYINDSKSTNTDSLKYALMSFDRPLVLIAGGYDKNASFEVLRPFIPDNLKSIVLIGQTSAKIEKAFMNMVECERADSLGQAVEIARKNAMDGDVILLSPGCASYDMFRNFEDRGDKFKELVMELS